MSDAEIACRSIFHDYDKNEIRAMPTSVRMAWQAGAQLVADEAAAPVSAPSVMLFDGGSWDLRGKQGEKLPTARAIACKDVCQQAVDNLQRVVITYHRPAVLEEAAQVCDTKAAQSSVAMFGVAMRLAATAIRDLKNVTPQVPTEGPFCPVDTHCKETPPCPWPCKRLGCP